MLSRVTSFTYLPGEKKKHEKYLVGSPCIYGVKAYYFPISTVDEGTQWVHVQAVINFCRNVYYTVFEGEVSPTSEMVNL